MGAPLGWFSRRVLVWALSYQYAWIDPLTDDSRGFASIERAVRAQQREPASANPGRLLRNILDARDDETCTIAVGALLAHHATEMRIARVTAYALGHAFRDLRSEMNRRAR